MDGYIYQIKNLVNNKVYIGQTFNIENRFNTHVQQLNTNTHINPHLQSSFNKYGMDNFKFSILLKIDCSEDELTQLEDYYMLKAGFPDDDKCYNIHSAYLIPRKSYDLYQHPEELLKDYKTKIPVAELEKKYNLSANTLRRIVDKYIPSGNCKPHTKRWDVLQEQDNIVKMYMGGESVVNIAKKYKCSTSFIYFILDENNINLRGSEQTQFKKGNEPYNKNNGKVDNAGGIDFLKKCIKKHLSIEETAKLINCEGKSCITTFLWRKGLTWSELIKDVFNFSDKQLDDYQELRRQKQNNDTGVLYLNVYHNKKNLRPFYIYKDRDIARSYIELQHKVNDDMCIYDIDKVNQYIKEDLLYYKKKEKNHIPYKFRKTKKGYYMRYSSNYKTEKRFFSDSLELSLIDAIKTLTIEEYNPMYIYYLKEYLKCFSYYNTSLVDMPNEVSLSLNSGQCNNNCMYCFNDISTMPIMNFEVAKNIINNNLNYITSVSITGGEPLLNDDLSQIIDYAHDNNLKTKIDTSLNGDINNISSNIDLINISIKNYSYLLSILDNINYLVKNHYCCEFNLVYHNEYIDKEECKKINNIISSYNIPLILVEMDVSYCDFDESPSRDELIELSSLFDVEDIYIQTKQHGREKL